jgi:hypothetical protein
VLVVGLVVVVGVVVLGLVVVVGVVPVEVVVLGAGDVVVVLEVVEVEYEQVFAAPGAGSPNTSLVHPIEPVAVL